MKHIVKFNQASDANNYEIKYVPFLTTVGENNQLLTCDEENKKIIIDSQGNASVVNGVTTNTFTINGTEYTYVLGMTWEEWIASTYNTSGMGNDLVYDTYVIGEGDDEVEWTDELEVNLNDLIESTEYTTWARAH